ncbi:hypothetical protein [Cohnella silvisoli]|uniref:DUF4179 domain-containing protein n=1 Tax=Cohnella silvisoli TaxID=2873699 RepID=A0ABV1KS61_9BACL|nr:hypothetical protein [Cohnella silvisoli]MCD9022544.1 hypothetical protein [Cohnella silvisoli]
MSNKIKQEIDKIPIPPDLHLRSLLGIEQAKLENEQNRLPSDKRYTNIKVIAAALLGLILLTVVISNTQVLAAIQKALQFVPGIGIVKEEDSPTARYVLKNPITKQIGEGSIVITGIMVDQQMTLITITGTNTTRFEKVKLVNEQGAEFTVKRSMSTWGSHEWSASFWYDGQLDLKGSVKLFLEEKPEVVIPLTLVQADTFTSYADMGETATANGITITAIANRVDDKARFSLVAQHSKDIKINDYGFFGLYAHENQKMNVMDSNGKKLPIENIHGIFAPASEFYFKLSEGNGNSYELTIPEIYTEAQDKVKIEIPTETTENLNQTFEIAGFPVTITRIDRLDDKSLRMYVDLHYSENTPASLHMFSLDSMSNVARMNDQTGELVYLEFDVEPNHEKQKITFARPEVLIRGPWKFELPADKYFDN